MRIVNTSDAIYAAIEEAKARDGSLIVDKQTVNKLIYLSKSIDGVADEFNADDVNVYVIDEYCRLVIELIVEDLTFEDFSSNNFCSILSMSNEINVSAEDSGMLNVEIMFDGVFFRRG